MSSPKDFFYANTVLLEEDLKGVFLGLKGTIKGTMTIIGSSARMDVERGVPVREATLYPGKGSTGLVALKVFNAYSEKEEFFLLKMDYSKPTYLRIDLETSWSSPEWNPEFVGGHIEIEIEREIFSTEVCPDSGSGYRLVSADLLCSFLSGNIGIRELKRSANEHVLKLIKRENELEQEVVVLRKIMAEESETNRSLSEKAGVLNVVRGYWWFRLFAPRVIKDQLAA
jgi:hypothetical protein